MVILRYSFFVYGYMYVIYRNLYIVCFFEGSLTGVVGGVGRRRKCCFFAEMEVWCLLLDGQSQSGYSIRKVLKKLASRIFERRKSRSFLKLFLLQDFPCTARKVKTLKEIFRVYSYRSIVVESISYIRMVVPADWVGSEVLKNIVAPNFEGQRRGSFLKLFTMVGFICSPHKWTANHKDK